MKGRALVWVLLTLLILSTGVRGEELSGQEIMEKVDANQFIASAKLEVEMITHDGDREIKTEMIMYVESDGEVTNALMEFINPRDEGVLFLLLEDTLWMRFPQADDLVEISGYMLEEGMMGSDASYRDILESEQLTELYTFEVLSTEELDGRNVYLLEGVAREGQEPAYSIRKFWVDAERWVILKEEMYGREGNLMQIRETKEVEEVATDRWMPMEMIMENQLKEDSKTLYRVLSIDLDYEIPEGKISKETLEEQ